MAIGLSTVIVCSQYSERQLPVVRHQAEWLKLGALLSATSPYERPLSVLKPKNPTEALYLFPTVDNISPAQSKGRCGVSPQKG